MPTLKWIIACTGLALALTPTCAAQTPGRGEVRPSKSSRPTEAPKAVVAVSPVPELVRQVGQARVTYQRARDYTFAAVELPGVYRLGRRALDLRAGFGAEGTKVARPDFVTLEFFYPADDAAFKKHRALSVEEGGGRLDLGVMELSSRYYPERYDKFIYHLKKDIDFKTFERIAGGGSLRLTLGDLNIELSARQTEALRDLLKTIGLRAQRF